MIISLYKEQRDMLVERLERKIDNRRTTFEIEDLMKMRDKLKRAERDSIEIGPREYTIVMEFLYL